MPKVFDMQANTWKQDSFFTINEDTNLQQTINLYQNDLVSKKFLLDSLGVTMPEEFGFDAFLDPIKTVEKKNTIQRYNPVKGQTNRCAIIGDTPFVGCHVHWKDNIAFKNKDSQGTVMRGIYFVCKKGKCCETLGRPKYRIGCVLLVYDDEFVGMAPFSYNLYSWTFSEATYRKLREINISFPLTEHDLIITCVEERFKQLEISPRGSSVWSAKPDIKEIILKQAEPIQKHNKNFLAKDLTEYQIEKLLSGNASMDDILSEPNRRPNRYELAMRKIEWNT